MTTFNTGNPIGSTDARDLSDNAENFDKALNSTETTWVDRLGTVRKTRHGMEVKHDAQISAHESEHDAQMQSFENDFDGRLAGMAFTRVGSFTSGATLTDMRQVLIWEAAQGGDGHEYGWTGTFPKVVAAGATPATSGGIGAGAWVDRTDLALRLELTSNGTSVDDLSKLNTTSGSSKIKTASGATLQEYLNNVDNVIDVDLPPFNGDLVAAYNSIPMTGNTALLCGVKTYNILSLQDNSKPNIAIIGTKVPTWDRVLNKLEDGSGTILQGSIYNTAKGFAIRNLGIDRGEWVRTHMAAGVYRDTLVCTDFGYYANIRYGDLIILQSINVPATPSSFTHCALMERGSGVVQTGPVEVIYGYHGNVIKCQNYFSESLTIGRYQAGDIVTVKRDTLALTENVVIGDICIDGDSTTQSSGVSYESASGDMSNVSFGKIYGRNCRWGFKQVLSGGNVVNLTVASIDVSSVTGDGASAAIDIGSTTINAKIGSHSVQGCAVDGIRVQYGCINVDIGHGFTKACVNGYNLAGDVTHGNINASDNTSYGIAFNGYSGIGSGNPVDSGRNVNQDIITGSNNTSGLMSSAPSGLSSLNTTWVQTADNNFKVERCANKVRISGSLAKGASPTSSAATILSGSRPSKKIPVSAWGVNGGQTLVPVECYVLTDGTLSVVGFAVAASTVSFFVEYVAVQ